MRVGGNGLTGGYATTDTNDMGEVQAPQMRIRPSETEIAQLFQKAAEQYEECMRLADLADISDQGEVYHPRYAWDNPIGLVVTRPLNAELV